MKHFSKYLHFLLTISIAMFDFSLSNKQDLKFRAFLKQENSGRFELTGAIQKYIVFTKIGCFTTCILDINCITFFYNDFNKQCILHSKDFIFERPKSVGSGWNHYIINDGTGRCPFGAMLYRPLNFCYIVDRSNVTVFNNIKQNCRNKGGSLAVVDSQPKQLYFEHFLAGRTIGRVAIAGEAHNKKDWTLDDGTPLKYFNWGPKQPDDSRQHCLELFTQDKWYDMWCKNTNSIVYVCEIKGILELYTLVFCLLYIHLYILY